MAMSGGYKCYKIAGKIGMIICTLQQVYKYRYNNAVREKKKERNSTRTYNSQ
jgi:hypothetical protein